MKGSSLIALYRRLPSFSTRFHITFGLSSLLTSVVLLAAFTGFVPDREGAVREGRVGLAEGLASSSSMLLRRGDLTGIRNSLEFTVKRNTDLSAVVLNRLMDNSSVVFTADGEQGGEVADAEMLVALQPENALDKTVIVPLYRGEREWGELQFVFGGNEPTSWFGRVRQSPFTLMAFVGLVSFPLFYFYLGRMLKALDPSRAVPGRVRSALDTIAESLFVIDRHGTLVLANAAFADLVGQSSESLLGVPVSSLGWIVDESPENGEARAPWARALDLGVATRQDMLAYVDAEGVRHRFIVNCSPVSGSKGQVGGVLVSMDDVTRLEEQEQLLRESMEAAEEASDAKSAFLSNMSHEIRTPMTAILGFTDVLRTRQGQTEAERQRHLETISTSGTHLLGLINDLLDLSKVEQGAMEMESIHTEPVRIASGVVDVLRVKAEEKGIDLTLQVVDALPQSFISDPSRLRQIITNLVGNAIKFTEQGGVTIRIGRQGDALSVSIVDTGIGMDAAQQESIFDAFTQADATITRRFGGTGLGLSISRELARALGGEIVVASAPGEGSTFTLTVPFGELGDVPILQPDALLAAAARIDVVAQGEWVFPPARVLVVDDAAENRELLSLVLTDLGLNITLACNGQEAVDAVAEAAANDTPFEVVMMDIQMPVMDGFQAVACLRESGIVTPVVALTANAMKGYEAKLYEAGFSHYQTKPIDFDRLTLLLGQLLGGTQKSPVPNEKTQVVHEITNGGAQLSGIDGAVDTGGMEPLISSLLSNNPKFRPIVERFLPRLDEEMAVLRAAVESERMEDVARIAHWLKGSAGNVGYADFTEPAQSLESCAKAGDDEGVARELALLERLAVRVHDGWEDELPQARSA